jgi:hypothetical protein
MVDAAVNFDRIEVHRGGVLWVPGKAEINS